MASASDSAVTSKAGCACRAAVTRAYRSLASDQVPNRVALQAAVRVYRHHHPEVPLSRATETVECWVFDGLLN